MVTDASVAKLMGTLSDIVSEQAFRHPEQEEAYMDVYDAIGTLLIKQRVFDAEAESPRDGSRTLGWIRNSRESRWAIAEYSEGRWTVDGKLTKSVRYWMELPEPLDGEM